ncbi:MAG: S-adenosylmethionine decarboxylase [Methanolinea sp.]|nr:S-adenosylmethionine decarboxylase [Methanolinea sp.]
MLEMKREMTVRNMKDEEVMKTFRKENAWGLCTMVDLKGCNPETIRDPEKIREFIVRLCDLIEMKRFGDPTIVHFGPNERVAGYSMTQLIETSLVSGHFANESNSAYLDIFSCKEYPPEKTAKFCKEFFGAKSMNYNVVFRF